MIGSGGAPPWSQNSAGPPDQNSGSAPGNLIMKANEMCRSEFATPLSVIGQKNLGYIGFEFTLLKLSIVWTCLTVFLAPEQEFFFDCCPTERFSNVQFTIFMRRRYKIKPPRDRTTR